MSKKQIFNAVMCFALLTGFCLDGFAKNPHRDMAARKKLLEKYKDHKLVRDGLDTILFPKFDVWKKPIDLEEANKFFGAPRSIADENPPKAIEALVDLLDFELGTIIGRTVEELISDRGRETIPFLKRKISQKPLCSERTVRERNEAIVTLLKHISLGVKYIPFGPFDDPNFNKEEALKAILFYAQMDLEKYYCKKGCYPKELTEAFLDLENYGKDILKFYYKSYGQIYFLCALGEDGKFGTEDDVKPPYNTDVFSFPENFKE